MAARDRALKALARWESTTEPIDIELDRILMDPELSPLDKALIQNLCYGVMRWRGRIDWTLDQYVKGGLRSLPVPIRNALRLGLYQIDFLDRIPPHAAVNESVRLARKFGHKGTAGLVNAVLRNILSSLRPDFPDIKTDPVGHVSVVYSHPRVLVSRWIERYGVEDTILLCEYDNQVPRMVVRANGLKGTSDGLARALEQEGVEARPGRYFPECLEIVGGGDLTKLASFRKGLFQVQDEATLASVRLLAPAPGETVIDLCAAPGGKTTYIAELMKDQGQLVAHDVSRYRLDFLRGNIERLGVKNCEVFQSNPASSGTDFDTALRRQRGLEPNAVLGSADAVLVDAPCTGTGTLARRADSRWKFDLGARTHDKRYVEDHERYHPQGIFAKQASRQLKLLQQAADLVKVGGRVVYSTCSLEPEENERVIERFLASRPEFRLDDPAPFVPAMFADGNHVRILPHKHAIDGAYAARLVKRHEGHTG